MGLIIALMIIGVMSAMILPTSLAKNYMFQAKYIVSTVQIIENAENAYIVATNGQSANLSQLEPNYIDIPLNGGNFQYPIGNQNVNISVSPGSNSYTINMNNINKNYAYYMASSLAGSSSPSCSSTVCNIQIVYSY